MLIIDDHPLTCKGYSIIISEAGIQGKIPLLNIDESYSLENAYQRITEVKKSDLEYDVILLDINMPPCPQHKIFSGEDLGMHVRKLNPEIKILVQTGLVDNHRLYSLFKNLDPDGIIIKTDMDENTFVHAIENILNHLPYYSKTFTKLIRNQFAKAYVVDSEDRELLYLLSKGVPSKNIPNFLPWSLSKVEKRKRLLRAKLGVEDKSVLALVNGAKKAGFI